MLAKRIMKWMLCTQEALDSETFLLAICADFPDWAPLQRIDVLSICCNLVVYDEFTDAFRFAHLSVQEYLENLDAYSPARDNSFAAEQCLWWLVSSGYGVVSPRPKKVHNSKPALKSIKSWRLHTDIYRAAYSRLASHMMNEGRLNSLLRRFLLISPLNAQPEGLGFDQWMNRIMLIDTVQSGTKGRTALRVRNNDPRDRPGITHQLQLSRSSPPDPIFVICAFDLYGFLPDLLRNRDIASAFTLQNAKGINCGQVAARCNKATMMRILFQEILKNTVPVDYWNTVLFDAVANQSYLALYSALGGRDNRSFLVNDITITQIIDVALANLGAKQVMNLLLTDVSRV